MASSPAQPSTPSEPRRTFLNRSVTVPTRLTTTSPKPLQAPAEIGATEGVEILYVHPNANIIKFTTTSRPSTATTPSRQPTSQGTGTLPWASATERTMAAGPLEIYRVPGSVSFLHSGALLHAILPRSNCWCVDGVSKFALRVLPDTYYRIELPGETEEDLRSVEELKGTLRKVLFFERTPCPFARGFEPEAESTEEPEVKEAAEEQVDEADARDKRRSVGAAKKWRLQGGRSWRPEGWTEPEDGEGSEAASERGEEDEDASDGANREDARELEDAVQELSVTTPSRPKISTGFRSVTAPSPAVLRGSAQPSNLRTRVDVDGTIEAIEKVERSRADQLEPPRMRTLQAIPTDMPPSPPDSSAGADYVERESRAQHEARDDHEAESRDRTVESETLSKSELGHNEQQASPQSDVSIPEGVNEDNTPALGDEYASGQSEEDSETLEVEQPSKPKELPQATADAHSPLPNADPTAESPSQSSTDRPTTPLTRITSHPEDPYAAIQSRILARRSIGRTTALPPFQRKSSTTSSSTSSSTISRRSNPRTQKQQQAFTTALLTRTYSVFLGPPARLVAIMLKIAARYADAAFGVGSPFYVESPRGQGERVPGSFMLVGEDEGSESGSEEGDGEWGEDDFGVPLRSPVRIAGLGGRGMSGWDVD